MKVYLSSDMEGTAGIVDWAQCVGPGAAYDAGCRLLLGEVNAAIEGAVAGGATSVLVNDSHYTMNNLPAAELHPASSYLAGRDKPLYMMQDLDTSFDAIFFVSYHASAGTAGVLSHTYNPRAIVGAWLDGHVAGESAINALVARAYGVPVVLISGDQYVGPEAEPFCPGLEVVQVKEALGRTAAHALHPAAALDAIRGGAERALKRLAAGEFAPPVIGSPALLELELRTEEMVQALAVLGDRVECTGVRRVRLTDDDPLRLYRTFVAVIALTRAFSLAH